MPSKHMNYKHKSALFSAEGKQNAAFTGQREYSAK